VIAATALGGQHATPIASGHSPDRSCAAVEHRSRAQQPAQQYRQRAPPAGAARCPQAAPPPHGQQQTLRPATRRYVDMGGGQSAPAAAKPVARPPLQHNPVPVTSRVHARIGLLGNPSDGFYGKTISLSLENFYAEASAGGACCVRESASSCAPAGAALPAHCPRPSPAGYADAAAARQRHQLHPPPRARPLPVQRAGGPVRPGRVGGVLRRHAPADGGALAAAPFLGLRAAARCRSTLRCEGTPRCCQDPFPAGVLEGTKARPFQKRTQPAARSPGTAARPPPPAGRPGRLQTLLPVLYRARPRAARWG
jgi:hypothetical protein